MTALGLLLLALALLGAPLFAVIAASALLGFGREQVDLSVVAIEIYRLAEMPALVAIPLFTFAGYVLGESQAPDRLVQLTGALLGWLRGGLGIVSLASCALFPAVPPDQTGIRFTVTRHHRPDDLDRLLETLADFLPEALAQRG